MIEKGMTMDNTKYARMREEMVRWQIEGRGITDPSVLSAMRKVPRHLFVSEALMDQAYGDYPLPIGEQQTISQPLIVAEMTQALELSKKDRVLEIGTGSGYQAAILSKIVAKVYTIERKHALFIKARALFEKLKYHNIETRCSDGTSGWKEESPFDAIIVTAGAPDIPQTLLGQLKVGGRLVIPVGSREAQDLIRVFRREQGFYHESLGKCRFVRLIGKYGWSE